FTSELEDMPHLHTAARRKWAGTIWRRIPTTNSRCFNNCIPGEVPIGDQTKNVLLILVGTGDPAGTAHDPRIYKERYSGLRLRAQHLNGIAILQQGRADVSRHQIGVFGNVIMGSRFNFRFTSHAECIGDERFKSFNVDLAVSWHRDDE